MPLDIYPLTSPLPKKSGLKIYPIAATFHPDTLSWRDRAVADSGLVEDIDLIALNPFVEGIYSLGLRDRVDAANHIILELLPLMGSNLASCLTKLWYPSGFGSITNVNFTEEDYFKKLGLKGNGVNKRIDSSFAPSLFLSDSISAGVFNGTDTPFESCEIGLDNSTPADSGNSRIVFHTQWSNDCSYFDTFNVDNGRVSSSNFLNSYGFIFGNRISPTNCTIHLNGNQIAISNTGGGIIPSGNITYYALRYKNQITFYSPKLLGLIFLGHSIPTNKITVFNTLVQNLMTALGRAV